MLEIPYSRYPKGSVERFVADVFYGDRGEFEPLLDNTVPVRPRDDIRGQYGLDSLNFLEFAFEVANAITAHNLSIEYAEIERLDSFQTPSDVVEFVKELGFEDNVMWYEKPLLWAMRFTTTGPFLRFAYGKKDDNSNGHPV